MEFGSTAPSMYTFSAICSLNTGLSTPLVLLVARRCRMPLGGRVGALVPLPFLALRNLHRVSFSSSISRLCICACLRLLLKLPTRLGRKDKSEF